MRSVERSIAALLVASTLALAVTASGFVGLRCRMTGMVSLVTCCPEPEREQAPADTSIGEPGCCEQIVVANAKPAALPASVQGAAAPVAHLAALVPTGPRPLPPVLARAAPPLVPPRLSRPPLRLLKRSLLI